MDVGIYPKWDRFGFNYENGEAEQALKEIGEGKGCTMETINDANVYAWVEQGRIVIAKPDGKKRFIGEGEQPALKAIDNNHVICVWENKKHIYTSVLEL